MASGDLYSPSKMESFSTALMSSRMRLGCPWGILLTCSLILNQSDSTFLATSFDCLGESSVGYRHEYIVGNTVLLSVSDRQALAVEGDSDAAPNFATTKAWFPIGWVLWDNAVLLLWKMLRFCAFCQILGMLSQIRSRGEARAIGDRLWHLNTDYSHFTIPGLF